MAKEKTYMPLSTAGLVRYFEKEESIIKLKPEHVIIISILFSFIVVLMKLIM